MSKCTHDSSEVIFTHNEISVEICSWGCSELLVSTTKENGITVTFTAEELSAMQARIEELEKEVETDNWLIMERQRLLDVIPECEAHGKCVPHAIEWINEQKAKA